MALKKFKIYITVDHMTTIHIDTEKTYYDLDRDFKIAPHEFNGHQHNFNGIKGLAVMRAVQKLFGTNAYWFGSHDNYYSGQVFRSLKHENSMSTSLTNRTYLVIEEL